MSGIPTFAQQSRSPHGERGLKYGYSFNGGGSLRSLSSWRAWIEIGRVPVRSLGGFRRSPHGERGLKYAIIHQ